MRAEIELLQNAPVDGNRAARRCRKDYWRRVTGRCLGLESRPGRRDTESPSLQQSREAKCDLPARANLLRRDFQKSPGVYFAIFKFVHCDAVASVAPLRPGRVGLIEPIDAYKWLPSELKARPMK